LPIKKANLIKKEKKNIILDILFENIIPNTDSQMFWGLDMLTAEIRKHNVDVQLHINKLDVKRIVGNLSKKRKDITLHMVNNNIYFKFF